VKANARKEGRDPALARLRNKRPLHESLKSGSRAVSNVNSRKNLHLLLLGKKKY
jgi:hypothetical protein